MNTKEYIESGILEAYVVGSVTEQEQQEVRCLSSIYPEIKQALEEIEDSMAGFATEYSMSPPDHLKAEILKQVDITEQLPAGDTDGKSDKPFVSAVGSGEDKNAKIRPIRKDPNNFPWRIAATVLLLISCGLLYFLMTMDEDYESELTAQRESINALENQVESVESELQEKDDRLALLMNKGTDRIILSAASEGGQDEAIVYWHPETEQVWLDPDNLVAPDNEHQYQLWALKGDQPIDLGVIDKENLQLHQMKGIGEADAFAITLEPVGGSPSPTLEQLKVIGQI
ncbi:anti-sigma factor [Membranihabitans maritimus]|uniref:anti-sigma factor n=1 Tax=Membranihabitans maritimus TaxID=2904244 RepID=UPI001F236F24|nr:anti-sigma factor [Membranihabitans maritimus]